MPTDHSIRLELVSRSRAGEFQEMIDEWKARDPASSAYGSIFAVALTNIDAYFSLVEELREGRGPIANLVPSDTFWIDADGEMTGTVKVRYELNAILMQRGGNIGYSVRPRARGRGLAQAGLRLALDALHGRAISQALLTCDDDNHASAHIIEKAGGQRIEDAILETGVLERRYWVPTAR